MSGRAEVWLPGGALESREVAVCRALTGHGQRKSQGTLVRRALPAGFLGEGRGYPTVMALDAP